MRDIMRIMEDAQRPSHPVTSSPAFQKWFAGSKVVNADGSPKVCYHGTFESFGEFKRESDNRRSYGMDRLGFWFDEGPETPSYFATGHYGDHVWKGTSELGNVMPVYLRIRKPFKILSGWNFPWDEEQLQKHAAKKDWGAFNNAVEKLDRDDAHDGLVKAMGGRRRGTMGKPDDEGEPAYEARIEAFRDEVISEGYDGFYLEDTYADAGSRGGKRTNWWIAFHANQIKSAISNSGSFSADNPSVTEGEA